MDHTRVSRRVLPLIRSISFLERFLLTSPLKLCHHILGFLSKPDLVSLGCSSSICKEFVDVYSRVAWNIDAYLTPWFDDPQIFRSLMAFTGAVISGSQALRFFDRLPPDTCRDLDIFVRPAGAMSLTSRPSDIDETYPIITDILSLSSTKRFCRGGGAQGIIAVFDFEKPQPEAGCPNLKVQIIVVAQHPVHHIVYNFHSTIVINYVTYREAVSVFPKTTFLKRVGYVTSRRSLGNAPKPSWIVKYEKRGYTFDLHSRHPSVELADRSTGDNRCWRIAFDSDEPNAEIEAEANNAIYGPLGLDELKFELSWVPEEENGRLPVRFRLGIYEPELWDYIFPWHMLH
ncbi:hypothetical protein DFP72DRAFT_870617 [Ephemerocybe angulata]|uniref:F-box domain-containing protein n=1 Tax=Ephemerocybe angulata TaxID=980116 RepID=A0A8H6IJ69_9AGAR|nr:hypothetical protein DFP72DRAFT_870617 [Tulosesus angulatus]